MTFITVLKNTTQTRNRKYQSFMMIWFFDDLHGNRNYLSVVTNLIFLLVLLYSLILLRQKIMFLSRYLYSCNYSKAVHFKKGCFLFCRFVDRKVVGLMPRYHLLAGDTGQISIFSLYNTKTSKQHRYIL